MCRSELLPHYSPRFINVIKNSLIIFKSNHLHFVAKLHLFFVFYIIYYIIFYIIAYLLEWIANNFMLCVCRGEAVRLFHVWHEIFPALPPGETQTHSYGYASIYRTQFNF